MRVGLRAKLIGLTATLALATALAMLPSLTPAARATPPAAMGKMQNDPRWNEIKQLIAEQKFQAALGVTDNLLKDARAQSAESAVAHALVQSVQLRLGLGGYETAVRFLREAVWPKAQIPLLTVRLFYAATLEQYQNAYDWEIRRRERVTEPGSKLPADLKLWTAEQIYGEEQVMLAKVWSERAELGATPATVLGDYLVPNDYPAGVRATLRDTVTYLIASSLANSSRWRPAEENKLFQLAFAALLRSEQTAAEALLIDDAQVHPLLRANAVLRDLASWNAANGKAEAALAAQLERLKHLHQFYSDREKTQAIIAELQRLLPQYKSSPWWSEGMAEVAQLQQGLGDLVAARDTAKLGASAYPQDHGGKRCSYLANQLESPEYELLAMNGDGLGKRSLEVRHRNLTKLYFRAYQLDLLKHIEQSHDYSLLPSYQDYRKLSQTPPAAQWQEDLPATPDLAQHRSFITPKISASGLYYITASADPNFGDHKNKIVGVSVVFSRLAIMTRNENDEFPLVTVVDGDSGQPVAKAEVLLYRYDYGRNHAVQDTVLTDQQGAAKLKVKHVDYSSYFVVARRGADIAIDMHYLYLGRGQTSHERDAAFIYTDRGIYRPGQSLQWKVLAYHGLRDQGDQYVAPHAAVTVRLVDTNGQVVATETGKTNAFGSFAGAFNVPTGRLLGRWQLVSTFGSASASVQVEEYKRPSFELSFLAPTEPLRLNREAKITGQAHYFFGLPVTSGKVNWRVTRVPVYPWWWGFCFGLGLDSEMRGSAIETVATGTSAVDAEGKFSVKFLPEVAEPKRAADNGRDGDARDPGSVTYRYRLSADLTDEGGETRSTERNFRLGFVAVEGGVALDKAFGQDAALAGAATPLHVSFTRSTLDGAPRAGKAHYQVFDLKQPVKTVMPADLPLPGKASLDQSDGSKFLTPGDALRPRTDQGYTPEATTALWATGEQRAAGELEHDASGAATVNLPFLAAGAYRIRYSTVDEFGAKFITFKDFFVAGKPTPVALPLVFTAEANSVPVGGVARFFVHSGIPKQIMFFDLYQGGKHKERRLLHAGAAAVIEIPVTKASRGGFGATLTMVSDHQYLHFQQNIHVPWDDKELSIEFASFRDTLRPGQNETWKVHIRNKDPKTTAVVTAEVLALMYDKSLELFGPHQLISPTAVYPDLSAAGYSLFNVSQEAAQVLGGQGFERGYPPHTYSADRLAFLDAIAIGGPGLRRGHMMTGKHRMLDAAPMATMAKTAEAESADSDVGDARPATASKPVALAQNAGAAAAPGGGAAGTADAAVVPRSNFAETAFFQPQLLTGKQGDVTVSFAVPDSVTAWNVWVMAVTKDLRAGTAQREVHTVKDLMVRPYMPRFLREGDTAELKVVVNNAAKRELSGDLQLEILDGETNANMLREYGVTAAKLPFKVKAGGGTNLSFPLRVPPHVGTVAIKVTATAGDLGDGELRSLPILPGRMHLMQSRFVSLKGDDHRTLQFADLANGNDPSRINEQMVVSVDAQLFYGVLKALPYLVQYPYECMEQTLNRFLSTGIVSSVFSEFPAIKAMAKTMSSRTTQLATWDLADPNRRMGLEETPWLIEARGGSKGESEALIDVLDERIAKTQRDSALAKLTQSQASDGGFSWFPGGPSSPYMTLYIMEGFAKAAEFGVTVPKALVTRGWDYLANHLRQQVLPDMLKHKCCFEFATYLNYVAGSYPDPSWVGDAITAAERAQLLELGFKNWQEHSPYLKGYLALTLKRAGRNQDAKLVWDSVMDSAKTATDQGTYWAAEERSWLWYNDTIETHAFALRTLMELEPKNPKIDGMVLWLFLNKKLNHWKSTRATAEVIYSLVHYLKQHGALGVPESATVKFGGKSENFVFDPERYVGKSQIVTEGAKIDPQTMATTEVTSHGKNLMFASATWNFSTAKLPATASGDFYQVTRQYFLRQGSGSEFTLKPIAVGDVLAVGDELEVQLMLKTKHETEYVQVRDPRGAGFEPVNLSSGYKWDLGVARYEEVRDSGTNFYFENLPVGEYTLKYRVRATMAGAFKVGPATVQSMYAPEFAAYSAGNVLQTNGN